MIKDAAIVMMLGMGTVFLVLLALLGLMTLGGKLAIRFAKPAPTPKTGGAPRPAAAKETANPVHQADVAVAVAAARRHDAQQTRGDAE